MDDNNLATREKKIKRATYNSERGDTQNENCMIFCW